jgi:hypothetical protein
VQDPKTNVVANLGLYIEDLDLYISKLTYVRKKCGGFFVSYPYEKYQDREGKNVYQNYCWFGKRLGTEFQEGAHKAINEHIANLQKKPIEPTAPVEPNPPETFTHHPSLPDAKYYLAEPDAELPF